MKSLHLHPMAPFAEVLLSWTLSVIKPRRCDVEELIVATIVGCVWVWRDRRWLSRIEAGPSRWDDARKTNKI